MIVIRASTEPSIDEHDEIFETTEGFLEPIADHVNVSRKSSVTFGTCHVHQIEPVAYLSSGSSLQSEDKFYTDAELKDLIESEAIALTEDAIFLAKQEIFREFNSVSDETIVSIANELVFDVIDHAIRNRVRRYENENLENSFRDCTLDVRPYVVFWTIIVVVHFFWTIKMMGQVL